MFGKKPDAKTALSNRVRMITGREQTSAVKAEQTRAARRSLFKNATILLDSGVRYDVAIKDVSEDGARIEFFQDLVLDGDFTVIEPMLKLNRRARLAWRKDGAAGLSFLD